MTFRSGRTRVNGKSRTIHSYTHCHHYRQQYYCYFPNGVEFFAYRWDKSIGVSFYCIHNWFEKHVLSWQIIPPHILWLRLSRWQRFHSSFATIAFNRTNIILIPNIYFDKVDHVCLTNRRVLNIDIYQRNGSYFHFVASISSTFSERINFAFTAYLHLLVFISCPTDTELLSIKSRKLDGTT